MALQKTYKEPSISCTSWIISYDTTDDVTKKVLTYREMFTSRKLKLRSPTPTKGLCPLDFQGTFAPLTTCPGAAPVHTIYNDTS